MAPNTSGNIASIVESSIEGHAADSNPSNSKQRGVRFDLPSNQVHRVPEHEQIAAEGDNQQQNRLLTGSTNGQPAGNSALINTTGNLYQQSFDNYPAGMSTMGGISPFYGGGYGSPYGSYGGMYSPMGMASPGPLSNLNQFLFGVQSVIFSLGQAVQIIGMNTQALKQLFDSVSSMVDHAISSWNEMRRLEAAAHMEESEEAKKERRRLRTIRLCIVSAASYLTYRIVRRLLRRGSSTARLHASGYGDGRHHPSLAYGESPFPHGSRPDLHYS